MLDVGYTTDTPANGQVNFLLLPVLKEDHRPEAAEKGVQLGKLAEEHPRREACGGGEDQEAEVGLYKGKVKSNVLAELVPDFVKVGLIKKIFLRPLLNPGLVESMVVQREDTLDILPLAIPGGDTRTTIIDGLRQDEIDQPGSLSLGDRLILQGLLHILIGAGRAHAMQPVLEASAVDVLGEKIGRGDADEDEEGVFCAVANFSCEADFCEGFDELNEGGFRLGAFWEEELVSGD